MLMYTDGLIERRGEDLAEGIARVARQLQGWRPGLPLGHLCERLVESLTAEPQLDDVCVLAVRRPHPSDGSTPRDGDNRPAGRLSDLDDPGARTLSFGCG